MTNQPTTVQVAHRGVAASWILVAMLAWVAMAIYALATGGMPLGF